MAVAFMKVVSALFPRILSRVWNVGDQCGPGVSKGLDNLAIPSFSVRSGWMPIFALSDAPRNVCG